jgi:hypothetical protein
MKSKIMVIAGTALALAITAMEPVHAKGCECTGQDESADKPVSQPNPSPFPPKASPSGGRVSGGYR